MPGAFKLHVSVSELTWRRVAGSGRLGIIRVQAARPSRRVASFGASCPDGGGGLSWRCLTGSQRVLARPPEPCACLPRHRGMMATRPVAMRVDARRVRRPLRLRSARLLPPGACQQGLRTRQAATVRLTRAMPRRRSTHDAAASRCGATRCGLWRLLLWPWWCLSLCWWSQACWGRRPLVEWASRLVVPGEGACRGGLGQKRL